MDNQNLGDIIRNGNTPTNNTGMPNTDPMAAIRQATGLDLNVEDFKTQVNEQMNPTPTTTPRVTGGIGVLTPVNKYCSHKKHLPSRKRSFKKEISCPFSRLNIWLKEFIIIQICILHFFYICILNNTNFMPIIISNFLTQ